MNKQLKPKNVVHYLEKLSNYLKVIIMNQQINKNIDSADKYPFNDFTNFESRDKDEVILLNDNTIKKVEEQNNKVEALTCNEKLEMEIETLKNIVEKLTAYNTNIEKDIQILKNKVELLTSNEKFEREISDLNKKINNLGTEFDGLTSNNNFTNWIKKILYNENKNSGLSRQRISDLEDKIKNLESKVCLKGDLNKLENKHNELNDAHRKLINLIVENNIHVGREYMSESKYPVIQIPEDFTKIMDKWTIFLSDNISGDREHQIQFMRFYGETIVNLIQAIKKQSQEDIQSTKNTILTKKYFSCSKQDVIAEIDKITSQIEELLNNCHESGIEVDFIIPKHGDIFNKHEHKSFGRSFNGVISSSNLKVDFCVFPGIYSITSRKYNQINSNQEQNKNYQVKASVYLYNDSEIQKEKPISQNFLTI